MAAPKRSRGQRDSDLTIVATSYLHGRTQSDLAQNLGLSQQQIAYDLKVVRRRWLESSIRNFDEARAQELAKIDHIEAEFWSAWERSQSVKQVRPASVKRARAQVRRQR